MGKLDIERIKKALENSDVYSFYYDESKSIEENLENFSAIVAADYRYYDPYDYNYDINEMCPECGGPF